MPLDTPLLSPAREHLSLLFGHLADALDDSHLTTICAQHVRRDGSKGAFHTVRQVPTRDLDAIASVVQQTTRPDMNVWVSVNPLRAVTGGRGTRADVKAGVALYVDVDVAEHEHAKTNLPTRAEASAWLDELSRFLDLLVVETGGGFHAYVPLGEALPPPEWDRLAGIWKTYWVRRAAAAGRDFDAGIPQDSARVLRPAGTWNAKQPGAPLVAIVRRPIFPAWPAVAVEEQLLRALDTLPEVEPATAPTALRFDPARATRRGDRPGDRFAYAVPAGQFLRAFLGAAPTRDGGLNVPRPDGTRATDASMRLRHRPDHPETVTVFGDRMQRAWGLEDERHNLSSFDLLVRLWLGGDYRAGAEIVRGLNGQYGPIFTVLRTVRPGSVTPDALRLRILLAATEEAA